MADIDYSLLPKPREEIPGLKLVPKNASREPVYDSKLSNQLSFVSRFDPIYSMSHFESTALDFRSIEASRVYNGILPGGNVVGRVSHKYLSALDLSVPDLYSYESLVAMSLLGQFHTITTAQLSSFLDIPIVKAYEVLTRLFGAGVILRAEVPLISDDVISNRIGHVWRISSVTNLRGFVARWLDGLTDSEYILVTSGRGDISLGVTGSAGSYSYRHNLQMTETILRIYETSTNVAGILGEQASALRHLVPEIGAGADSEQKQYLLRENVGDSVLVGADGRLVIFELTTVKNPRDVIRKKASYWALSLDISPLDFYVVFANTNPEHNRHVFRKKILQGIHDVQGKTGNPNRVIREAQQRIFISDVSTHWFPTTNTVAPGLANLECYNPAYTAYYQLLPDSMTWNDSIPVINGRGAITTPNWIARKPKSVLGRR